MVCQVSSPGGGSKKVSSWGILCHEASHIFDAKWRGAPLEFHLTPYEKFAHVRPGARVRRIAWGPIDSENKNVQGPGSPLPLARCSVWACTSRNLWWRIAFLKVFLLSACTSRKDPGVDFTAILCGPRSLTKATLRYGYQLFC